LVIMTRKSGRSYPRLLYYGLATLLTLALVMLHLRLYDPPAEAYGGDQVGPDVVAQLHFLGPALRAGAGGPMQDLFPEGFFFSHVLYGLAWVDVGARLPPGTPLHDEALREARWALAQLDTPAGRAPFAPTLDPPYGVFYVGWTSRLRGGVVGLQPPAQRDAAEVARLTADCAALARAFAAGPTPFLMAYPGQAWPVDSTVAIAALRQHDALLPPRYAATIAAWIAAAQTHLDPATGLLPHQVDPRTGRPLDGARGSSQSVIVRFLTEIDPVWGQAQYQQFRRQFVTTVGGLPGVREYPLGQDGAGDVDSGPLLGGVSLSATVVTLGAALAQGDRALSDPLLHAGEFLGLPISWEGAKRYAFGQVPVGDAFLVWAKTARPPPAAPPAAAYAPVVAGWWRVPLHLLGLAFLALVWLPAWWRRVVPRRRAAR
jgi:hypothetical protein